MFRYRADVGRGAGKVMGGAARLGKTSTARAIRRGFCALTAQGGRYAQVLQNPRRRRQVARLAQCSEFLPSLFAYPSCGWGGLIVACRLRYQGLLIPT